MNIFLTGATGFIGRALSPLLIERNHNVTRMVRADSRNPGCGRPGEDKVCCIHSLDRYTDISAWMVGIDVVIHLAGIAHMPAKSDYDEYEKYMEVNCRGTRAIATQAAQKGVKRFVFLSSICVNGKSTLPDKPFTVKDSEMPYNSYSESKLKAEMVLRQVEKQTGMEVVILRPPLVYGPGVKGNFLKLLRLVDCSCLPLPFAGINNQRSMIGIDNLIDAIELCAVHELAAGRTFMVCDQRNLSTSKLIEHIYLAMGKTSRLFSVPEDPCKSALIILGKQGIYERLWGSLTVDSGGICRRLGWKPKLSVEEGLNDTVQWYSGLK